MKTTLVPINEREKNQRGYIEFLPDNYNGEQLPVLFWLHGIGSKETGWGSMSELQELNQSGMCNWLKGNNVPFIVLVPQDNVGYFGSGRLESFMDFALRYYGNKINPHGIHTAGYSGGGYGLGMFIQDNSLMYQMTKTFTPMSTNFQAYNDYYKRIIENDQYVWFHHGVNDFTKSNKIQTIETFHYRLHSVDARRSRLTAYEGMGHSAWNEVYDASGTTKAQSDGRETIIDAKKVFVPYYKWTSGTWWEWMLEHSSKADQQPPVDVYEPLQVFLKNSTDIVYKKEDGTEL